MNRAVERTAFTRSCEQPSSGALTVRTKRGTKRSGNLPGPSTASRWEDPRSLDSWPVTVGRDKPMHVKEMMT